MAISFEINAEARSDAGKGASRRLRRTNWVPAILYGGAQDPQPIQIGRNELKKHLEHEAFYSHVLSVKLGDGAQKAVLKAVQHHPYKDEVMHIDLQRVSDTDVIRMHVPVHVINEATSVGVKKGGQAMHNMTDVEITCMAKDLPEFIEVDLAEVEVGQAIHLSELKLPEGVEIPSLALGPDHDFPVVSIHGKLGTELSEEGPVVAPTP
jgi:large subunit ribosomal protein L25